MRPCQNEPHPKVSYNTLWCGSLLTQSPLFYDCVCIGEIGTKTRGRPVYLRTYCIGCSLTANPPARAIRKGNSEADVTRVLNISYLSGFVNPSLSGASRYTVHSYTSPSGRNPKSSMYSRASSFVTPPTYQSELFLSLRATTMKSPGSASR